MQAIPSWFHVCHTLAQAVAFHKEHGYKITSADDPDGEKGYAAQGAAHMALQDALEAGEYRVKVDDDPDVDLSWDDTEDAAENIRVGVWVHVQLLLERRETYVQERTGTKHTDYEVAGSLGGIVSEPGALYWTIEAVNLYTEAEVSS